MDKGFSNTYICVINTQIKIMTFTSKDNILNKSQTKKQIFLAGSMASNPNENWRQDVINKAR